MVQQQDLVEAVFKAGLSEGIERFSQLVVRRPAPKPRAPKPDPDFLGREEEIAKASVILKRNEPLLLWGMPGIGKTAIASKLADHRDIVRHFRDGIFWFHVTEMNLAQICDEVARSFGLEVVHQTPTPEGKATYLNDLLNKKRVLLVLDNADNTPGISPFCQRVSRNILVTSRERISDLPYIEVKGLKPDYALQLLQRKVRNAGINLKTEDVHFLKALAKQVVYHPLALRLLAGQLTTTTPKSLVEELQERGLDPLRDPADPNLSLRAVLESSYTRLPDKEKAIFASLGVFAENAYEAKGFSSEAIRFTISEAITESLALLVSRAMIEFDRDTDRYDLHPLLRVYASEKLGQKIEVHLRAALYFAALAKANRGPMAENLNCLAAEVHHLFHLMDWCTYQVEQGSDSTKEAAGLLVAFMVDLNEFFDLRGYWIQRIEYCKKALFAARKSNDKAALPVTTHNLGAAYHDQGNHYDAERLLQESLALARESENKQVIANTLRLLGKLAEDQGESDKAEPLYQESQNLAKEIGDSLIIGKTLHRLGWLAESRGDHKKAEQLYGESLALARELGDKLGIFANLNQLGVLAQRRRDLEAAEHLHLESLELCRELGFKQGLANVRHQLGRLSQERGDYGKANRLYEESLALRRELGYKQAIASTLFSSGMLAKLMNNPADAEHRFEECLSLRRELGNKKGTAETLVQLGLLREQQGILEEAATMLQQAVELQELDSSNVQRTRRNLARVREKLRQKVDQKPMA